MLVSVVTYGRPNDNHGHSMSNLAFGDSGSPFDSLQLSFIRVLLIGSMKQGSYYHVVSWSSPKSKRPVRFIDSGGILAVTEGIDEIILLKNTYSKLLRVQFELIVVLDSKDL